MLYVLTSLLTSNDYFFIQQTQNMLTSRVVAMLSMMTVSGEISDIAVAQ